MGGHIDGRTAAGTSRFGGLQGRLDHPGNGRSYFVLKMRPARSVDQLRGNADTPPCSAHRSFEDVTDAQFAADLVDCRDGFRPDEQASRRRSDYDAQAL